MWGSDISAFALAATPFKFSPMLLKSISEICVIVFSTAFASSAKPDFALGISMRAFGPLYCRR